MIVFSVIAILTSPVIAILISIYVQNRKEKRSQKFHIFNTLIATRHNPINEETVRALNMIDVVFYDCQNVRKLWREYFEMLCNKGLENEIGMSQTSKKCLEMITEISKALGYGKAITHLDVDRVYNPVGLVDLSERLDEITKELLRVLKASSEVQIKPKIEQSNTN